MEIIRRLLSLQVLILAVSVVSCVRDGLSDDQSNVIGKEITTLEEQVALIEETIDGINALKGSVDGQDALLEGAAASLENLASYLSSGPAWADGTLATLAGQKALAMSLGAIYADTGSGSAAKTYLKAIDSGVGSWLGKEFGNYWSASLARVKMNVRIETLCIEMKKQKMLVGGAGL